MLKVVHQVLYQSAIIDRHPANSIDHLKLFPYDNDTISGEMSSSGGDT